MASAIQSHGVVDKKVKEKYGQGKMVLRIGNGGAGATGLIEALSKAYLEKRNGSSIGWVCNHSRNTQLALLNGYVDLALTYERDQEKLAASEGWSIISGCAFHDNFVLAGPASDPAGVGNARSIQEALKRLGDLGAPFHSRVDASATMWKERGLWTSAGIEPWIVSPPWYKTSLFGPADALVQADKAGAYLLTDRSTILRQTWLGNIGSTTVFFEPTSPDDVLMNSCYALYPVDSRANDGISDFLRFLMSKDGQNVVANFGKKEVGHALFAPVEDGYARDSLVGGVSKGGKWVKLGHLGKSRL